MPFTPYSSTSGAHFVFSTFSAWPGWGEGGRGAGSGRADSRMRPVWVAARCCSAGRFPGSTPSSSKCSFASPGVAPCWRPAGSRHSCRTLLAPSSGTHHKVDLVLVRLLLLVGHGQQLAAHLAPVCKREGAQGGRCQEGSSLLARHEWVQSVQASTRVPSCVCGMPLSTTCMLHSTSIASSPA